MALTCQSEHSAFLTSVSCYMETFLLLKCCFHFGTFLCVPVCHLQGFTGKNLHKGNEAVPDGGAADAVLIVLSKE